METKFESGRHCEVAREMKEKARADGWCIKVCPIVRHGETIVYKPNGFMILLAHALTFRRLKFDFPVNSETLGNFCSMNSSSHFKQLYNR